MRVGLFVDGSFLPSREGATQRICLLARHLPRVGIETAVFHCYRGWSDIELIRRENFTTYLLPPEIYYGNSEFVSNIVLHDRIDLLQMCDPPLILSQGIKIKQETKVPLVWEVHEVVSALAEELEDRNEDIEFLRLLEHYSCLVCDYLVCFTEEDRQQLCKRGVALNKVYVFPCGIVPYEKKFWGPNLDSRVVLFLGNMFYEPNYRGVLSIVNDIYPMLSERKRGAVTFKMVGTCPEELRRQFANSELVLTGPVKDLDQIFSEAAIGIAPIKACSGMRIKILDYMAAGLPVIASTFPLWKEIVIGNKCGVCVNPLEPKEIAKAIEYLIVHPDEAEKMGANGRKAVLEKYSWENEGKKLLELYKILTRGK